VLDEKRFHTTDISMANIDGVAAIEQCCFQSPWSAAACAAEITMAAGGGFAVTCGSDGTIAGYIFYRVMVDEMHIMKIATLPRWRKQQIATALLQKAINLAREKGLWRICLEVRASNLPAVSLYQKFGFTLSGRRPGYYENREDAVLMNKNITEEPLTWQHQ
jgi:ribosomal-protein-alanine N-acetyltransferase